MVFNLALHYVQNLEDAEEIAQDTFVIVYQKRATFNARSSIKTWIYRIAIHKSLDFIKTKKSNKRNWFLSVFRLDDSTENQPIISSYYHPGIELEHKESAAIIFKAIDQLPYNQRTALILLKIEGRSQKETAEIMEIGVKAVESLFQRAKNNLEKLLSTKGI